MSDQGGFQGDEPKLESTYESSRQCLWCLVNDTCCRQEQKDSCQEQESRTFVNGCCQRLMSTTLYAMLPYAALCCAMLRCAMLWHTPIQATRRPHHQSQWHRTTHATTLQRLSHQARWRSATHETPCNALPTPSPPIPMAQPCEHARTPQQNQGKQGPPPDPHSKARTLRYAFEEKGLSSSTPSSLDLLTTQGHEPCRRERCSGHGEMSSQPAKHTIFPIFSSFSNPFSEGKTKKSPRGHVRAVPSELLEQRLHLRRAFKRL